MAADTKTVKRGGLSSRRRKKAIVNVICFILLAAASLTVIMPLWFMISTAFKKHGRDIYVSDYVVSPRTDLE